VIPAALGLGVLIAKAATVAAIPRAVKALRAFFCEPKSVERTSTLEKSPQSKTPSAIPPTGTKAVVFTHNSLNQRTSPGTNLYDAKGQTKDQAGRQFEWDDDGRCTAIIMGTHRSEFAYDGYGRRVRITEKENNVVQSDKLYFWLAGQIVCERDALQPGSPVVKRFFGQGLIANGTKLYYTTDQLGSVRELVDSSGVVRADYRYSVYGERTKVGGDLDSDWGWAGLWHHEPSGLDLATYRVYDPEMGRWLSRDPLGEGVDYNLYRYCGNDPVGCVDPAGLDSAPPGWDPIEFRKGKYKKSKVKDPCASDTLFVTFLGLQSALIVHDLTVLAIDAAAYHQMTRRNPTPPSPPTLTTNLPSTGHHANQLNPNSPTYRGWTPESINATVNSPTKTGSTINHATGNPATAYFNEAGHYVVRDNVSGDLVQMSNQNYPIGSGPGQWAVDSNIQMNP